MDACRLRANTPFLPGAIGLSAVGKRLGGRSVGGNLVGVAGVCENAGGLDVGGGFALVWVFEAAALGVATFAPFMAVPVTCCDRTPLTGAPAGGVMISWSNAKPPV